MAGQQWGRLSVLSRAKNDHNGQARWLCKCECGTMTIVRRMDLRTGNTTSCGCARIDQGRAAGLASKKHGQYGSRSYRTWKAMKERCLNPNHLAFHRYGGRGVTICDRWSESFENFFADMGERPAGLTLDRINPDGNYEPGNCRWATPSEQRRNQSQPQALIKAE